MMFSSLKPFSVFYLAVTALVVSIETHAATFTVTQSFGCGAGTIVDAVNQANANPGLDRIEFAPGITELKFNCEGHATFNDYFLLSITESVDIIGPTDADPTTAGNQLLTVDGEQRWFDSNGNQRPRFCPSVGGIFAATKFPGFVLVGRRGQNNSNISVKVENIKITRMNSFAKVYEYANLTARNVNLRENADIKFCNKPLIEMKNYSSLNLDNVEMFLNLVLQNTATWLAPVGIFAGFGTNVTIVDSEITENFGGGAIDTSGYLTIVSSIFQDTGGIKGILANIKIVNSAFLSTADSRAYWQGIYSSAGAVDIRGSTFTGMGWSYAPYPNFPTGAGEASILRFVSSLVLIDSTAIHASFPSIQKLPLVYADAQSTMNVSDSYASDGSLTSGDGPAPPWGIAEFAFGFPTNLTPLDGGPLIDRIDNSTSPLINPLTNLAITHDILGHERVIGTGRDIGAVELPACTADSDCAALIDQCNNQVCNVSAGLCEKDPAPRNGDACDDGMFCTTGEVCSAGTCGGGTARDCSGVENQCNDSLCSETHDLCQADPKADGTACTDTLACTSGETCHQGHCGGSTRCDDGVFSLWNGFLRQLNVVSLLNKSNSSLPVRMTVYERDGSLHHLQVVTLQPMEERDLSVNNMFGYGADTYGFVGIESDRPDDLDAHTAHYRFSKNAENVEFAIAVQHEIPQTGTTFDLFNTMQPSTLPEKFDHEQPQWLQMVNLAGTAKGFTVRLRNYEGQLLNQNHVVIQPHARLDVAGGHVNPGAHQVGLIEVEPDDATSPYLAELYHYSSDGPIAAQAETYSFAGGSKTSPGSSDILWTPVSTAAGGVNWLVIANVDTSPADVSVTLRDNEGNSYGTQNVRVEAKHQVHISIGAGLPEGQSGIARIESTNGANIIARSNVYFLNFEGRITAHYSVSANANTAGTLYGAYNTFMSQFNWLKLFNVSNSPVDVTITAYEPNGSQIGQAVRRLTANSGSDFELGVHLGLSIPQNSYGIITVESSVSGAVSAHVLRVKPSEVASGGIQQVEIDLAKAFEVR